MRIPQGPIKDQIIECGNRTMAPNTLPTESDPDPKPPERPIMKLFAYLRQSMSLVQNDTRPPYHYLLAHPFQQIKNKLR